jgi:hypothetical protein
MSARNASPNNYQSDSVVIQGREARLTLSEDSVVIHRGGIEFRSPTPFAAWTEMTLALRARDNGVVNCSGVVISCSGTKHAGYHVSMVFTGVSKQAQARLDQLVHSSLA